MAQVIPEYPAVQRAAAAQLTDDAQRPPPVAGLKGAGIDYQQVVAQEFVMLRQAKICTVFVDDTQVRSRSAANADASAQTVEAFVDVNNGFVGDAAGISALGQGDKQIAILGHNQRGIEAAYLFKQRAAHRECGAGRDQEREREKIRAAAAS